MDKTIQWISTRKTTGDEWKTFFKDIEVGKKVKKATIKLQSDSICGVFINDEFITSATGKYPERVTCREVTRSLNAGSNRVYLKLGSSYYQNIGLDIKDTRGWWYSNVAFELYVLYEDGEEAYFVTDESWETGSESETGVVTETIAVTDLEYNRIWSSAAEWFEQKEIEIDDTVLKVTGNEYAEYAKNALVPERIYPIGICKTNMTAEELSVCNLPFTPVERKADEDRYVIFEFERLVVGFTETEIRVSDETKFLQYQDHTETTDNFDDFDKIDPYLLIHIQRLSTQFTLKPEEKKFLNLYRRAFRYVKLVIGKEAKSVLLTGFSARSSLFPVKKAGWFSCDDKMLNDIWEMGKYTLHINKQQEYESCPRNEMKYFSGDGIICSLVDYYAFGDNALSEASLSFNFLGACNGITRNIADRTYTGLWDYDGWRIVSVYNEYKHYKNLDFIKKFFDDSALSLEWYISRMDKRDLIYNVQFPGDPFNVYPGSNEWTDGGYRVGEKASINCMFYKCLVCMSELAEAINDDRAEEWRKLSYRVKTAINEHLWSEEKKAYIDKEFDYIPHDGNTLAVLFGVADKKRAKEALNTIKEKHWTPYGSTILDIKTPNKGYNRNLAKGGNTTISPSYCFYETTARFMMGETESALELIKRCWGSMIRKGAKTFWEYAPNDEGGWGARNHGWSSGCTYALSAYVLGVVPSEYGWDKIKFSPQTGSLNSAKGVVPTEKGDIAVRYSFKDGKKHYTLAVPKAISVETDLPAEELSIIAY